MMKRYMTIFKTLMSLKQLILFTLLSIASLMHGQDKIMTSISPITELQLQVR